MQLNPRKPLHIQLPTLNPETDTKSPLPLTPRSKAVESSPDGAAGFNPNAVLSAYQTERLVRASTIHGMAGMAAFMASTYKAYLGEGLGPLSGELMNRAGRACAHAMHM